jgi:hypothetical protein
MRCNAMPPTSAAANDDDFSNHDDDCSRRRRRRRSSTMNDAEFVLYESALLCSQREEGGMGRL